MQHMHMLKVGFSLRDEMHLSRFGKVLAASSVF